MLCLQLDIVSQGAKYGLTRRLVFCEYIACAESFVSNMCHGLVIPLFEFTQVSGGGLRSLAGSGSKRPGMVTRPNLPAFGSADSDSDGAS